METPDRHPKGTIARVDFSEIERLAVYAVSASLVINFKMLPFIDLTSRSLYVYASPHPSLG